VESTVGPFRLRPARPRTLRPLVPRPADHAGWDEMVARHGDRLRGRIRRVFAGYGIRPQREMIDEAAQEVYLRLLVQGGRRLRLCRADCHEQVDGYLGRIAERVVINQIRTGSAAKRGGGLVGLDWSRVGGLVENLVDPAGTPEDHLLVRERLARLFATCRQAGAGRRGRRNAQIVRLALFHGRTSREIARRLRWRLTPSGIDSHLSRLRLQLAASGLELPRRGPQPRRRRRSKR